MTITTVSTVAIAATLEAIAARSLTSADFRHGARMVSVDDYDLPESVMRLRLATATVAGRRVATIDAIDGAPQSIATAEASLADDGTVQTRIHRFLTGPAAWLHTAPSVRFLPIDATAPRIYTAALPGAVDVNGHIFGLIWDGRRWTLTSPTRRTTRAFIGRYRSLDEAEPFLAYEIARVTAAH